MICAELPEIPAFEEATPHNPQLNITYTFECGTGIRGWFAASDW